MPAKRSISGPGGLSGHRNVDRIGGGSESHIREQRRLRGEISCAECRRLKLKCDKKNPCGTCTKRGCPNICPNGVLSGGQGTRFVLADTEKLHIKLAEMSKRIRQLEDALQIEYGMRTTEPHPLLTEELLAVKRGLDYNPERDTPEAEENRVEDGDSEIATSLGLLTISEEGSATYLGATGSAHALILQAGFADHHPVYFEVPDSSAPLPEVITQTSQLWPFNLPQAPVDDLQTLLQAQLPSRERASALCESFLQNLSWFFRPVGREQIMEELIPMAYPWSYSTSASSRGSKMLETPAKMDLHDLALLFFVFASGSAADLTQSQYNSEAERYRHLGRAALGLKSIFDGASLSAVQAICLLGSYDVVSGGKDGFERSWKLMCLGFSLSSSIGLHRDPARWNLEPKVIQRRRQVFWDLYCVDCWKSLATGRPSSFSPEAIDCEFPDDVEATDNGDGTKTPSLWRLKYKFAHEVLAQVATRLCAARQPKYSEILDMDRKLREFDMSNPPPAPKVALGNESLFDLAQSSVMLIFREIVLLYIHRNYFARAILDHPDNPLRSPFAPSFLAAYRSAVTYLKNLRIKFNLHPQLFSRNWPTWTHALGATVIMGSVVVRCPESNLAASAFLELEAAVSLFGATLVHPVAKQGLPMLIKLRERARCALNNAHARTAGSGTSTLSEAERRDEGRTNIEAIQSGREQSISQTLDALLRDAGCPPQPRARKGLKKADETTPETLAGMTPNSEASESRYSGQASSGSSFASAPSSEPFAEVLSDTFGHRKASSSDTGMPTLPIQSSPNLTDMSMPNGTWLGATQGISSSGDDGFDIQVMEGILSMESFDWTAFSGVTPNGFADSTFMQSQQATERSPQPQLQDSCMNGSGINILPFLGPDCQGPCGPGQLSSLPNQAGLSRTTVMNQDNGQISSAQPFGPPLAPMPLQNQISSPQTPLDAEQEQFAESWKSYLTDSNNTSGNDLMRHWAIF